MTRRVRRRRTPSASSRRRCSAGAASRRIGQQVLADALVQSHRAAAGSTLRGAGVRAADRVDREGAHADRRSSSAISTRRAICTMCATRFAPTRAIVERGEPGRIYNVCSGQAFKIARRARPIGRDEPRTGHRTRRSRPLPAARQPDARGAIEAGSSGSSAGSPKFRWIRHSRTCLTIGERR